MMLNVSFYNGKSHMFSDGPRKIPVFPQLPFPKLLLQKWELAKQSPSTLSFLTRVKSGELIR
jgi:hypothetical protein